MFQVFNNFLAIIYAKSREDGFLKQKSFPYKTSYWAVSYYDSYMLLWFDLKKKFGDYSAVLDYNMCQISWRYLVFENKDLTLTKQFVWQLYTIVLRFRRFWQMCRFLGINRRVPKISDIYLYIRLNSNQILTTIFFSVLLILLGGKLLYAHMSSLL